MSQSGPARARPGKERPGTPAVDRSFPPGRRRAGRGRRTGLTAALWTAVLLGCGTDADRGPIERGEALAVLELPPPSDGGGILFDALRHRRSIRSFQPDPLDRSQLGQLAWAAQGVTDGEGHRTAPSAGATYPLELWVVLPDGLFHYEPDRHRLVKYRRADLRPELPAAAYDQEMLAKAPAVFVLCGVVVRTERKYEPAVARRYVQLEAGHAAQNLLLQATALGLGAVPVGGIDPDAVRVVLGLSPGEQPLYAIPVGRPQD